MRDCKLMIHRAGEATNVAEAWALLPATGTGVVVLAEKVTRFDPSQRTGLLLEAEVVDGDATTMLRQTSKGWAAWRWVEGEGDDHRFFEDEYLSSEPGGRSAALVYRQYWRRTPDDGIQVWTPVGSRFVGFKEA